MRGRERVRERRGGGGNCEIEFGARGERREGNEGCYQKHRRLASGLGLTSLKKGEGRVWWWWPLEESGRGCRYRKYEWRLLLQPKMEEAVHVGNVVAEKETLLLLKLGKKKIGWEKVCSSFLFFIPLQGCRLLLFYSYRKR